MTGLPRVNCNGCNHSTDSYATHMVNDYPGPALAYHYCQVCMTNGVFLNRPLLTEEDFWKELQPVNPPKAVICDGCTISTTYYGQRISYWEDPGTGLLGTPFVQQLCVKCYYEQSAENKQPLTEEDFWKELQQ